MPGLDHEGFALLAEHSAPRRFSSGEIILEEGEPVEEIHLVVSGTIDVSRKGQHVVTVHRSRGVGFLSVFARDEHGVRAIAETDVSTLSIPAALMLDAFEENFSLVRNSLRLAANAIVERRANLPTVSTTDEEPDIGEWRDDELTLVERIIIFRKEGALGNVNVDAVVDLCRTMVEVRYEPGDILFARGDPPSFSLRIHYGRVRCTNDVGESVVVGSDFILGSLDPIGNKARRYGARALTKVIGYRTAREDFLSVLEAHSLLALELLELFMKTLIEMPPNTDPPVSASTTSL